jgi:ubiquinone/menaquinone biosynthesis C-methylase UbiE
MGVFDYGTITEDWGTVANQEQASMAATRYQWLAEAAEGKELLDLSSGTGYGLASVTGCTRLIASDLMYGNVHRAREKGIRAEFLQADASRIPLRSSSIDVVACIEALYYLSAQPDFFHEAARVLRPGGTLLVSLPNRHRLDFEPGGRSTSYPDAIELRRMSIDADLIPAVTGAYSWADRNESALLRLVRRALVRTGLIPKSMRAKSILKRLVYRHMQPLSEAVLTAPAQRRTEIPPGSDGGPYTMLYLEATKP